MKITNIARKFGDYDAYESACWEETEVTAYCKLNFTLKNKANVKISDGKHEDIFKWDENDFEDFGEKISDKVIKD